LRDATEADFVPYIFKMPLRSRPGTRYYYSNAGYTLLGELIRRLTGQFYADYLAAAVFRPAGMPTARSIDDHEIVANRARSYRVVEGRLQNVMPVAPILHRTADGSLLLSLKDLEAWARVVRARAILSPASWDAMFAPGRLSSGRANAYGLGWQLGFAGGAPYRSHTGAWQGFSTYFALFDKGDLTVALLLNRKAANRWRIVNPILSALDPTLVPIEEPCQEGPPDEPCIFAPSLVNPNSSGLDERRSQLRGTGR
jgi:CubicO group peptidase (beta-lactamase class C family)